MASTHHSLRRRLLLPKNVKCINGKGAEAPDRHQSNGACLEVVADTEGEGALESTVSGGGRRAVQSCFGVVVIVLANVAVGGI